ncbi:uncharacterized protein EV420DRAFT_1314247, partial [Desarmillaria tabescens]
MVMSICACLALMLHILILLSLEEEYTPGAWPNDSKWMLPYLPPPLEPLEAQLEVRKLRKQVRKLRKQARKQEVLKVQQARQQSRLEVLEVRLEVLKEVLKEARLQAWKQARWSVILSALAEIGQDESTIPVLKQRSYTTSDTKVIPSALADKSC